MSENDTYRLLVDAIDTIAGRGSAMKRVMAGPVHRDFFGGWTGCEVTSLYVAPEPAKDGNSSDQRLIEFLHEAVPDALDFPMFTVSGGVNGEKFVVTNVESADVQKRRQTQKGIIESPHQRTSAELCADRMQTGGNNRPRFLLLPFGEILGYCFLHHVLLEISQRSPDNPEDWTVIGRAAWAHLIDTHSRRQNAVGTNTQSDLLSALKEWYSNGHSKRCHDRSFLGSTKIGAIYSLPPKLGTLLNTITFHDPDLNNQLANFLAGWAQNLHNCLQYLDRTLGPMEVFWKKTLVNPEIEALLCTRALYVTIIRSPLKEGDPRPPRLSQAYAICTVFDSSRLELPNQRTHLDNVLRRLAQTDLAQYDYRKLERIENDQHQIQSLLLCVSNSEDEWRELMKKAARVCLEVGGADHVLISWSDIGALLISTDALDASRPKGGYEERWFNYLSATASYCTALARSLSPRGSTFELPLDGDPSNDACKLLVQVRARLEFTRSGKQLVFALPVDEEQNRKCAGLIVVFGLPKTWTLTETAESIRQVGLALALGMKMPFRSMIGRGLLSWLLRSVLHPRKSVRKSIESSYSHALGWSANPQPSAHRLVDWAAASILELAQVGFVAVGLLFLLSVFSIIVSSLSFDGHDTTSLIVQVLTRVEHTVIAFSICLAATGVVFLLKPGTTAGVPPWMQRFSELGTLEKTLARLAAMVLTVDVLKVIFEARISFPKPGSSGYSAALWEAMQQPLFHVALYLLVLAGLAFLSKFLLNEDVAETGKKHEARSNLAKPNKGEENTK